MSLREFLNENTTRSSDEATHYGMKPTTGMWKIEPEAMSTFLPHYHAAVFENGEQWAIVEKAKPPVSIVKIDIDLKYAAPDAGHEPVLGSGFQQDDLQARRDAATARDESEFLRTALDGFPFTRSHGL